MGERGLHTHTHTHTQEAGPVQRPWGGSGLGRVRLEQSDDREKERV